jgi:antirestriction protein ArdC
MSAALRQRITEQIISALERGGLPPWRRPWASHPNAMGLPTNAMSHRRYSGVNVLLLQMHGLQHGLRSRFYATFNQWQAMNCRVTARPKNVPPGQWGCGIIYCAPVKKVERAGDGQEREKEYLLLRQYTVFSADQVEGEAATQFQVDDNPSSSAFIDYEPAERAIAAVGADIRFGGDRAFYRWPTPDGAGDFIQLPHKHQFPKVTEFYATALHELGHWSESRLGWTGTYAEGELRAEMAAAYALAELGVPQSDDLANTQSYLSSWLNKMRDDPHFIFRASAEASQAVDFLLSFSREQQPEPEAEAALVS